MVKMATESGWSEMLILVHKIIIFARLHSKMTCKSAFLWLCNDISEF